MTQSNMLFIYSVTNQRIHLSQFKNPLRGSSSKICEDLPFPVLHILINSLTEDWLAYMVVITHIFRKILLLLKMRRCISRKDIDKQVLTFEQEEGKEYETCFPQSPDQPQGSEFIRSLSGCAAPPNCKEEQNKTLTFYLLPQGGLIYHRLFPKLGTATKV